jgi:hypothetical protein
VRWFLDDGEREVLSCLVEISASDGDMGQLQQGFVVGGRLGEHRTQQLLRFVEPIEALEGGGFRLFHLGLVGTFRQRTIELLQASFGLLCGKGLGLLQLGRGASGLAPREAQEEPEHGR